MPNKSKLCENCNKTRASCGLIERKPTHCGKCKSVDMINVTRKRCEKCQIIIPAYGIKGNKATHCVQCKTDDMIHINGNKCCICNKVQAVYGTKGDRPKYCVNCKEDTMIDLLSKRCIVCNKKQPTFSTSKEIKASHCGDCKTDSMIDVKTKMCIVCKVKCPIFGLPNTKNTHCGICKLQGMIDLKNIKCIECKSTQATYASKKGEPASHCKKCKPIGYIDVKHKLCITPNCQTRVNKIEFGDYCSWCFQHLFPESPHVKLIRAKTYETEVAIAILEHDKEYKHDAPLYLGGCDCSIKRRIDFWKIIGNTILAIEVDEQQHKSYDKKDEIIRYDDLYMGFAGKWVFIRFNPNKYKDKNGKIINKKLSERISVLISSIDKHTERILKEQNMDLLEIHTLFFDE
jgi:hypothetical protein